MSIEDLRSPPREFSLMPFWFWNDALSEREIVRQIADFDAHAVYGFVIHPRVGLPREIAWMSDAMLRFMAIAVREARRRDMRVILYDEGMYPSGSSSGQVVAADPRLAARCLAMQKLAGDEQPRLAPDQNLVTALTTASGQRVAIIDRKADSYIRGIHYVGDGPKEDEPPAGDILNPETTRLVLRLVYDKYHGAFGEYFGNTILGVFTDEPNPLGKCREKNVRPGTSGIVEHVSKFLGYDFTPHLPALWLDDEPDAQRHRANYDRAIWRRLEETWYRPLSQWCDAHGVALCGHPAHGDQLGVQRYFTFPGQDLVWRFVEPDKPSALEGPESTQGKVSSSAMIHLGRKRNSNEFCGAYGHQTTFEEMKWLADWCMIRGVNLLVAHAFYYSIRGPRKDERPPQLGPWTRAWDDGRFKTFAEHCTRVCWLNATARHVCDIAILTDRDHCAWAAAKICFEHQRDFNYLDVETLAEAQEITADHIGIKGMRYQLLVIDGIDALPKALEKRLRPMIDAGHVVLWSAATADIGARAVDEEGLLHAIETCCARDVQLLPAAPAVRVRHLAKDGEEFYLLFNESGAAVQTSLSVGASGKSAWIDTATAQRIAIAGNPVALNLDRYGVALLHVSP